MDRDDGFLSGWVDGFEDASINALDPFPIDVQSKRLLVRNGGSSDSLSQRHDDGLVDQKLMLHEDGIAETWDIIET